MGFINQPVCLWSEHAHFLAGLTSYSLPSFSSSSSTDLFLRPRVDLFAGAGGGLAFAEVIGGGGGRVCSSIQIVREALAQKPHLLAVSETLNVFEASIGQIGPQDFDALLTEVAGLLNNDRAKDPQDFPSWLGLAFVHRLLASPRMDGRRLDFFKRAMQIWSVAKDKGLTINNRRDDARSVCQTYLPRLTPSELESLEVTLRGEFGRSLHPTCSTAAFAMLVDSPHLSDRRQQIAGELASRIDEGEEEGEIAFQALRRYLAGAETTALEKDLRGMKGTLRASMTGEGSWAIDTLLKEVDSRSAKRDTRLLGARRSLTTGIGLKQLEDLILEQGRGPQWESVGGYGAYRPRTQEEWLLFARQADPKGLHLPLTLMKSLGGGGEFSVYRGRPGCVIKIAHLLKQNVAPLKTLAYQEILERFGIPYLRVFDDPEVLRLAVCGIVVQPLMGPDARTYPQVVTRCRGLMIENKHADGEHRVSTLELIEKNLGRAAREQLERIWESLRRIDSDKGLQRELATLSFEMTPRNLASQTIDIGEFSDNLVYDPSTGWYLIDW